MVERDINVTLDTGEVINVTLEIEKSITVEFSNSGPNGLNGTFFGSSGTSGESGSSGTSGNGTSGTSGISGSSGTSGESGSSGTSGLGSSGTSGISGSSGTSGRDGTASGTSGTSGESGSSGTSGDSGTSGTSGISGSSGTSGISGSSGTSGFGSSGTSGLSGSSGTSGGSGSSGTSGESGSSGTSGLGTSGTSGISGSSGTSGVSGSSGTSGIDGSSGTSGINGSSGTSGISGSSGSSGRDGTAAGTSGTSGESGSSGTSGISGSSGTSGGSGSSGDTGSSGTSGISGSSGTSGFGSSGTSGSSAVFGIIDNLQFGTASTSSGHVEGRLFYDALWKTLSANIDTDVTLQIGQETVAYCKNNTGSPITEGQIVYITGADGGYPTIDLADATDVSKSFVLGMVTKASIAASGGFGHVTIRGHVNGLNTNAWLVGTSLYLSDTTPGALTSTPPSEGHYDVRVGRVMIQDPSAGRVYINIRPMMNLTDLGDVGDLSSKIVDDALVWNGTEWINKSVTTISAGKGVEMYLNGTDIIGISIVNSNKVETLSKVPWDNAETVEQTVVTSTTSPILSDIYLDNTALGLTSLPAGTWTFISYAGVSRTQGVTEILGNIMRVRPYAGTVSVTNGADSTHRVVTASEGTPFAAANLDVGGTVDSDSFLQTPQGVYRITARNSNTEIIILVPSTYNNNESTVAFSIHKKLFQMTTGEMNNITGASPYAGLQRYTSQYTQTSAITIEATDKLAAYRFSKTTDTSNNTVSFAYGGTTRYSHVETPLATLHNDLAGLNLGEYRHLTSAQSGWVGSASTGGGNYTSGTSGSSGTSGNSGSSGTSGISGSSGTSGGSGSSGASGEPGSSGTSGIDGSSGTSGDSGSSGTSGISGSSGTSGESGSTGTSGISGSSGTSGETGSSGTSGISGSSGTSGIGGTSGTSGTSVNVIELTQAEYNALTPDENTIYIISDATGGTSGTSGNSGSSGTSGVSGTSGTSPIQKSGFNIYAIDADTALTTGSKGYGRVPTFMNGMNVTEVAASLISAKSTSGIPAFQISRGRQAAGTSAHAWVSVLSAQVQIDVDEWDSRTAGTAGTIDTSNDDLATGDLLRVDCTTAGVGGKGLVVTIVAQTP
jgi:collagen type VII alpha